MKELIIKDKAVLNSELGDWAGKYQKELLTTTSEDWHKFLNTLIGEGVVTVFKMLEDRGWKINTELLIRLINIVDTQDEEEKRQTEYYIVETKDIEHYDGENLTKFLYSMEVDNREVVVFTSPPKDFELKYKVEWKEDKNKDG